MRQTVPLPTKETENRHKSSFNVSERVDNKQSVKLEKVKVSRPDPDLKVNEKGLQSFVSHGDTTI